jgi:hypothetical protein
MEIQNAWVGGDCDEQSQIQISGASLQSGTTLFDHSYYTLKMTKTLYKSPMVEH